MRGFNSDGEHVGRAKGTINKRTQEAHAIMERLGLDPLEAMIRIVLDDVPCSTCRGVGTTKYQPASRKSKCYLRESTGLVRGSSGDVRCLECGGRGKTTSKTKELGERTCESCYGSGKEKISPELKGKMLTEIAQYKYPKRKAIDHTVEAGGTIAEAMKRAVARVKEMK